MKNFIVLFFTLSLIIMIIGSCRDEDQPGYDQAINPLWEYNFKVGLINGIVPIVHNDRVIFSSAVEGRGDLSDNDKLLALDKTDATLLWEWSDHFESSNQHFDANSLKPIYQDVMALTIGGRNFAVNVVTGQTVWKNRNATTTSFSSLRNLSAKLYRTDIGDLQRDGQYNERIMEGDFHTGTWKAMFEVTGGDSLRQGLEVPSFYFEEDGDTIMVFTNTLQSYKYRFIEPRLISYNKTKKQTYYDILLDKPAIGNAVDWFPVIDGARVYIAVDDILVCYNVLTGTRIWECQLNANLLSAGFILVNGRIYANSEGYGYVWCIDAKTGNVIWKKPSPGTSSQIQFYNNTIYFVGGTDLNVWDASSGAVLATIKAPSSYKNSNDFFSECTIDPETGKLYATSYSTAYCYPPFR